MPENDDHPIAYDSVVPFDPARIGAAALYCSDGRWGEIFDDFLQNALELPRYDRLAVPGGAACLAGHFDAYREEDAVLAQLEFLITAHALQRVVLIAHQDCAFYKERLGVSPIDLLDRQRADLAKAVERMQALHRDVMVEAFLAREENGRVWFEWVGE
ncbi:MAG: carbonic anhydrase [Planctomycetota bacterium]|jgi:hypothetical protein